MSNKLLIINLIKYFPMGTLGVCDYLSKNNVPTKLLNLPFFAPGRAVFTSEDYKTITKYINEYKPTHLALILHWKENYLFFITAGEYIRKFHPTLKIICGGFTAGYFGQSVLEQHHFVDYLIYGDPEQPLLLLLTGQPLQTIPNLIYREAKTIKVNENLFIADEVFLSNISYANLSYLFEPEKYLELINQDLGFPLFIGRGCQYNCSYCGASNNAYTRHTKCTKFHKRSIAAISKDLKEIKKYTNYIYIGYENDVLYLIDLFKALNQQPEIKNHFNLVYSTWSLPNEDLLLLLKEFIRTKNPERNQIEISPELFQEEDRRKIRDVKLFFTNKQLIEKLSFINHLFGKDLLVRLFFSRYHSTQTNYQKLIYELENIINIRTAFPNQVEILYDHIATDMGSDYWENYITEPHNINSLYNYINQTRIFAANNQIMLSNFCCFYFPESLTSKEIQKYEKLLRLDKILFAKGQAQEMIKTLGPTKYLEQLTSQI